MGFTKLDERIITSSVMGEPSDIFKVWIAFLATCEYDGIARVTAIFLSGVCHLPIDVVRKAIKKLEAPDPDSRSKEEDGRRIIPVLEGWFVVNYKKYREFTYSDSPEAIRQRRHREMMKERDSALHVTKPRDISASASVSGLFKKEGCGEEEKNEQKVQADETKKPAGIQEVLEGKRQKELLTDEQIEEEFDKFWKSWPMEGRHGKVESRKKFKAICKGGRMMELSEACHGYADFLAYQKEERGFNQTPLYAKTFLNGQWEEYLGYKRKPKL